MSKCIKCGQALPAVGDCLHCAATTVGPSPAPGLLHKELGLDRRQNREPPAPAPRTAPPGPTFPPNMARPPAPPQRPSGGFAQPPPIPPLNAARPPPVAAAPTAPAPLRAPPPSPAPAAFASTPPVRAPAAAAPPAPITQPSQPRAQISSPPVPATARKGGPDNVRAAPAALWRRLAASAVDVAIIVGVLALYLLAASAVVGSKAPPTQLSGLDGWMSTAHRLQSVLVPGLVLAAVLALAYSATFALIWNGRTPGRVVAGIRLVDQTGRPPGTARAVVRALLSLVSFAAFLGGFWLALFDRRGQTLHDKLTRTFVIRPL